MPRTNRQTDEIRSKANSDRRQARTRSQRLPIYEDSDSDQDEELQRAMYESRQQAERGPYYEEGGPSNVPQFDEEVYDAEEIHYDVDPYDEPEEGYLDTEIMRSRFEDLLGLGYTRQAAYETLEIDACKQREPQNTWRQLNDTYDYDRAFRAQIFEGTCYPDSETMTRLGIREDVELLAHNCGLLHLLSYPYDTYKEETIQFLCTVVVHKYDPRVPSMLASHGGGYIKFTIRGEDYRYSFKRMQELFGFKIGTMQDAKIDRREVNAVWRLLTGRPTYDATNQKGTWIRNPAVNYFRRAIANTFFARDAPGNVNKSEAEMLVLAIKDLFGSLYRQTLIGDTENASFAAILAVHLKGYRKRYRANQQPRKVNIGGIVSAILMSAGVPLREIADDGTQNNIGFRTMNIDFLQHATFLHKKFNRSLFYRFIHPQQEVAHIKLPREEWTSLRIQQRVRRNAEFIPPLGALSIPAEGSPSPPPSPPLSPPAPFDYVPEPRRAPVMPAPGRKGKAAGGKFFKKTLMQKAKDGWAKAIGKLHKLVRAQNKEIVSLRQRVEILEGGRHSMQYEGSRRSTTYERGTSSLQHSPTHHQEEEPEEESDNQPLSRRRRGR